MGANGDAGNLNIGSAPDFLVGTTAYVDGILQGTRKRLAPHSTNTARVSSSDADNLASIRVHPSRVGHIHLKRVGRVLPAKVNAENLPFGLTVKLGAPAPVLPHLIASGRPGPLR